MSDLAYMERFQHPRTESRLIELVKTAASRGIQVRVRGSGHSLEAAIFTDHFEERADPRELNIMLDRYTGVSFDDARKRVTVQAGCHLSVDPHDPAGTSTVASGLLKQLDDRGWALPELGGSSRQTVAGFLSTGSSGGSVRHSLAEDALVAMRLIDGQGVVHELDRETTPELFHAAAVSMGLLGIVSTVTLQCVDRYDIIGAESITKVEDCAIDLYAGGSRGLAAFLRRTEYARLLWWPQENVEKMVVWQARRMQPKERARRSRPDGSLDEKPYVEIRPILGSARLATAAGGVAYTMLGLDPMGDGPLRQLAVQALVNTFVIIDEDGPRRFWQAGWTGLPMDDQIDDELLPATFTELWVPLRRTAEVMRALRDHYATGLPATGAFCCEIYATRRSDFWMSPAHGTDALRINLFWFKRNVGEPAIYFRQFWELLAPFGARFHWGKHLSAPDSSTGVAHRRAQLKKWDAFLALRARMDPKQIFVTDYWRRHLGIPG